MSGCAINNNKSFRLFVLAPHRQNWLAGSTAWCNPFTRVGTVALYTNNGSASKYIHNFPHRTINWCGPLSHLSQTTVLSTLCESVMGSLNLVKLHDLMLGTGLRSHVGSCSEGGVIEAFYEATHHHGYHTIQSMLNNIVLCMYSQIDAGFDLAVVDAVLVAEEPHDGFPKDTPLASLARLSWASRQRKEKTGITFDIKTGWPYLRWLDGSGDVFIILAQEVPEWLFVIPRNRVDYLATVRNNISRSRRPSEENIFHLQSYAIANTHDAIKSLVKELFEPSGPNGEFKNPTTGCLVKMWDHEHSSNAPPRRELRDALDFGSDSMKSSYTACMEFYHWIRTCSSHEIVDIHQVETQPLGGDFVIHVGEVRVTVQHKAVRQAQNVECEGNPYFDILIHQYGTNIDVYNRVRELLESFDMDLQEESARAFVKFIKNHHQSWKQDLVKDMSYFLQAPSVNKPGQDHSISHMPRADRTRLGPKNSSLASQSVEGHFLEKIFQSVNLVDSDGRRLHYHHFGSSYSHPWGTGIIFLESQEIKPNYLAPFNTLLRFLGTAKDGINRKCFVVRVYPRHYTSKDTHASRPFPMESGQAHLPSTSQPFILIGVDSSPDTQHGSSPSSLLLLPSEFIEFNHETRQLWKMNEDAATTQKPTWNKENRLNLHNSQGTGVRDGVLQSRYWLSATDVVYQLYEMTANADQTTSINRPENQHDFPNAKFSPNNYTTTIGAVLHAMLDFGVVL
jgi:hypothetical protein